MEQKCKHCGRTEGEHRFGDHKCPPIPFISFGDFVYGADNPAPSHEEWKEKVKRYWSSKTRFEPKNQKEKVSTEKEEKWICVVSASSNRPNGSKVEMNQKINMYSLPGKLDESACERAMLRALHSRRDKGFYFLGEEITLISPLGQIAKRIYDPDTRQLIKA